MCIYVVSNSMNVGRNSTTPSLHPSACRMLMFLSPNTAVLPRLSTALHYLLRHPQDTRIVCFCSGLITWYLFLPVERAVRTISGGVTVWSAPFRWPCDVTVCVWLWVLLFSFMYYTTCDRWKCDTNYYVAVILCVYCC